MKIRPVGAVYSCGQTDGQTDMTTLIVAFCSFVNATNNKIVPLPVKLL